MGLVLAKALFVLNTKNVTDNSSTKKVDITLFTLIITTFLPHTRLNAYTYIFNMLSVVIKAFVV